MATTVKQMVKAAKSSNGYVTQVAKRLGLSRMQVYRLMAKHPQFAEAVTDQREARKDFAESKLDQQIEAGNITAIIFYLKCMAKDRGYIERTELVTTTDLDAYAEKMRHALSAIGCTEDQLRKLKKLMSHE